MSGTFLQQLRSAHPLSRAQRDAIADYIERLESGANERRLGLEEAAYQRGFSDGRAHEPPQHQRHRVLMMNCTTLAPSET